MRLAFKGKETLNVATAELLVGPVVSVAAVIFAGRAIPGQMSAFKHFLAKHIVEPNLQAFEKVGGHVFKAYDVQDQRGLTQRFSDEAHDPHLPDLPYRDLTKEQKAYKIADVLTKTGFAFAAEAGAALLSQMAFNKAFGTKVNPWANVGVDVATQTVIMGSFMTFLSPAVEGVKDKIASVFEKSLGMKRHEAKDAARTLAYVSAPSWLSFLATLVYVNKDNTPRKR